MAIDSAGLQVLNCVFASISEKALRFTRLPIDLGLEQRKDIHCGAPNYGGFLASICVYPSAYLIPDIDH